MKALPWREQLAFVALFCMAFLPAYALGLWRGMEVADAPVLAMEWERHWPFVAWMILPYLSLFAAYGAPLFFVPERAYPRLTGQALLVVAVSGMTFQLLPTRPGFVGHGDVPEALRALFALVHAIDAPRNLVPSLHVAGAAVVLLASADFARPPWRALLRIWLGLIVISTLFVHQHHLLDLATGLGLALAVRKLAPLPAAARSTGQG